MKQLLIACCISLIAIGCSSSSGTKKVQVSTSESKALSALSNIQGNSKSGSSSTSSGPSLKAAILK